MSWIKGANIDMLGIEVVTWVDVMYGPFTTVETMVDVESSFSAIFTVTNFVLFVR